MEQKPGYEMTGGPRKKVGERATARARAPEVAGRLQAAMLAACGELGYRAATVQAAIDRGASNRTRFYELFADKSECFYSAYEAEADRLCDQILLAGRQEGNYEGGLLCALERLGRYLTEQQEVARSLLVEVHVARGRAMAKRNEVLERLSNAIDVARRENGSRHSPPPLTASFMVSAIEASTCSALQQGNPQEFATAIPSLHRLVLLAYFDDPVSAADLRPLGAY